MAERIPIGSDHAGFQLKGKLKSRLVELGFEVEDVGTDSEESTDYPEFAKKVASLVAGGQTSRGILMCGTGLGMSYAANRFRGVRAAVAWTPEIATLSRNHNDSNVLVLPARFIPEEQALEILEAWLEAEFEGGRHSRRVSKIENETETD
jgi:ribose 5-phosphate isomerase B